MDVIKAKCAAYTIKGKPMPRLERINDSDFSIVAQYQSEYRGMVEYYRMAYNLHRLNTLRWVMGWSLTRTLANKYRCSIKVIYARYQTTIETDLGPRKVLRVTVERNNGKPPLTTHWGGIPLRWQIKAVLDDQPPPIASGRTELLERLLADTCELCGSTEHVEVHHIRKLADLHCTGRKELPQWAMRMIARRRKTLVLCRDCHDDIHAGRRPRRSNTSRSDEHWRAG